MHMDWKSKLANLGIGLGVFLGFIAFCLLALPALPVKAVTVRPHVDDEAGLLSPQAEEAIEALSFPADVVVLVRTVDRLPPAKVASFAYEEMGRQPYWGQARPRSWYRWKLKGDPPWSTGVFILVSKDPALIQVRYGQRIRLEAYRAGLAFGPQYRGHQLDYRSQGGDQPVVETVQWLAGSLPKALALPWYLRWTKPVLNYSFSVFEEFLNPGGGSYPNFILQIISRLAGWGLASSGGLFLASLFLLYFLLWMGLKVGELFLLFFENFWITWAGSVGLLVVKWGFSFTLLSAGFLSLLLLGNGREEDALLLDSLGLQSLHRIGFSSGYYFHESGFVLALLVGIVFFVKDNITDHLLEYLLKDDKPSSDFNLQINGWFALYMILVLFLPRAISACLLLLNALEIVGVIVILLVLLLYARFMPGERQSRKAAH
jgi:hypothetical protein